MPRAIALAIPVTAAALVLTAGPAFAQATPTLPQVLDNLRAFLVGILAGLATVFLTIGGVRYLAAGGDPGQVEKAKTALRSAAIGYALAALAPLGVTILADLVSA